MADMDELALAAGGDGLEEDELLELNEGTDNGGDNTNDASVNNDSVDGDTSMDDPVRVRGWWRGWLGDRWRNVSSLGLGRLVDCPPFLYVWPGCVSRQAKLIFDTQFRCSFYNECTKWVIALSFNQSLISNFGFICS